MTALALSESENVELSVILPCFNEAGCVETLTRELLDVLELLGRRFEVIYVDDASTDGSVELITGLQRRWPVLRLVRHKINAGESSAQASGFRAARGRVVVTMDSDEQNDPADIPRLLAALEGTDAVCGVRRQRRDNWLRRLSTRVANTFRNMVTGDRITDAGCTFRAIRRASLEEVPVFNGMHRFLPTMLRLQGFRVVEIEVNHRPRSAGVSKYGVGNRAFRGVVDCLAMRWYRRRVVPAARTCDLHSVAVHATAPGAGG